MRLTYLFIIGLFLFSCSSKKNIEIPEGILNIEQMTALLTDVHLTESTINLYQSKGNDITSYTKEQYALLFKKHKITEKQFEENVLFYSQQLDILDEIYAKILENLSKKQSNPTLK